VTDDITTKSAFLHAILGTTGHYGEVRIEKDGTKTPRTEWQEGYNAAIDTIQQKLWAMDRWWQTVPETLRPRVLKWMDDDVLIIFIQKDEETGKRFVKMEFLVSDTFYYACADGAPVTIEDLPLVIELYDRFGYKAIDAYAAHQPDHGHHVLPKYQDEKYHAACAYLQEHYPTLARVIPAPSPYETKPADAPAAAVPPAEEPAQE
jgi:hypothetical protein